MKELVSVHKVCQQRLELLPEKAIFWEERQTLIIGDLHFGKAGHFRKSGIPVPEMIHSKDFVILEKLLKQKQPIRVIFLGDLFHSDYNQSWESFRIWIKTHEEIHFQLILGNHDILSQELYRVPNMEVLDVLEDGPFYFTHIPEQSEAFNIAGHLHPAIRLRGKGRQSIKVPCFYFNNRQCIIPAFGSFTGTSALKVEAQDHVYAIAEKQVIKVS